MKLSIIATATLLALANSAHATNTPPVEKQPNNVLTKIFGEKSEKEIKIKAIEDRIKTIEADQELLDIFKAKLLANISIIEEYTKAFTKKKPKLSAAIYEAILENAKNEEIKAALKENHSDILLEITTDVTAGTMSIEQLFKKYESNPVLLTLTYGAEKYKDEIDQDTNKQLLAGFEKSQKKGFPIYALGLLGLAGGGGGGGGGGGTTTCWGGPCTPIFDKASFETTEYNNQYGLGMIKASSVYQYGGFGDGITVAVFDSGIRASHEAFAGRIADGGYDYVTGASGVVADGNGHGSHVSGIIAGNKNNSGMHGVAYQSKILPFRFFDNSGSSVITDARLKDAISRTMATNARIFNHSWGNRETITEVSRNDILSVVPLTVAEATSSVQNGAVHVWAAGNNGSPQINRSITDPSYQAGLPYYFSDLQAGWVAVAAVGTDGVIASYSNRCGVAAAWCIAAPGSVVNSVSITSDSSYVADSGTSMAAPHVSGAIAALKTRFPNLSFQQVKDRILVTANKTGIYATTSIYGQGLMDLDAAASPVGSLSVPTSLAAGGASQSLGSSALALPNGVVLNGLPTEVLVLDSFQNAPFYISTGSLIQNKKNQVRFDYGNVIDESVYINQNGLDIRTGKNLNEFNIAFADSEFSFSLGFLNNSNINNKSLPSSQLNSNKNSVLVGYGVKNNDSTLNAYAWSELNQSQNDLLKTNLKQISFLPSFASGSAVSYESSLNANANLVAGMGVAAVGEGFGGFNGSGAFNLNPKSAISNWVGFNFSNNIGKVKSDTLIQLTQWNIKQDMSNSLLKSSDNLKINDIEFSTRLVSDNSKTSATISFGFAKTADSGSYNIALPTSIDQNGVISYQNASIAKNSLFNESRGQFKISHALSSTNTFSTFYGFRKNQQMEHLLGVGLNIGFK
jgi:subtilisin family serine protease